MEPRLVIFCHSISDVLLQSKKPMTKNWLEARQVHFENHWHKRDDVCVWSGFMSGPVSHTHPVLTARKTSRMIHLPQVPCLQHPNELITKHCRKLSGPLRNMCLLVSMETGVLFCCYWKNMDAAVFIAVTVTPLVFRHPPTSSIPLSSALISVR